MTPSIDELQPTLPSRGLRLLEACTITLAFPVFGWLINPDDPLLLGSGLTWLLAIAPLLVGMRYGFALGFSSGLVSVMLMGFEGWWYHGDLLSDASQRLPVAIALILVGMVAGEMADTWRRRLQQMTVVHHAQSARLEEFIRHYQLLRVSHDQLAERLAANPFTLRDALKALEAKYRAFTPGGDMLRKYGSELLSFLALHARVQQAALIPVDRQQRLQPHSAIWFGGEVALPWHDPMLLACLEQRRMICLKSAMDQGIKIDDSALLAVVPLIDVDQHIHAIVAITAMPFIDFHRGHLHLLAVLGAQLGDLLQQAQHTPQRESTDHRAIVAQWVRHARDHQLTSLLITIDFSAQLSDIQITSAIDSIVSEQRGLDRSWVTQKEDHSQRLYVLLPLTKQGAFEMYAERLKETIAAQAGIGEACRHIVISYQVIDGRRSAGKLLSAKSGHEVNHAHA